MKAIRVGSFVFAATILVCMMLTTVGQLIEFFTVAEAIRAIIEDPSIVIAAFYGGIGDIGFDGEFFRQYGPIAVVALLFVILVNSIT